MYDTPDTCPLCHHPQISIGNSNLHLAWKVTCPRCGMYYLSELLYQQVLIGRESTLFMLACVAAEWHLRSPYRGFLLTDDGKLPPEVSLEQAFPDCRIFWLNEMLAEFPNSVQIIDRALLNLSRLVKHPMGCINASVQDMAFFTFCPENTVRRTMYYLKTVGFVEDLASNCSMDTVTITPAGWQRIQEISRPPSESRQAFVAMWFTPEMEVLYKQAIEPAIDRAGFQAKKINQVEHNNDITDEIIAEIRKSRFVVADFTAGRCEQCHTCDKAEGCEKQVRPRGGVYFEAGFAKGLGMEVIWLVRKDQLDQVHFDVRQHNFIDYADAKDLETRLFNRISATI